MANHIVTVDSGIPEKDANMVRNSRAKDIYINKHATFKSKAMLLMSFCYYFRLRIANLIEAICFSVCTFFVHIDLYNALIRSLFRTLSRIYMANSVSLSTACIVCFFACPFL